MNKKLKLALATLLGFSAACSTVKNAPAKGEGEQQQEAGAPEVRDSVAPPPADDTPYMDTKGKKAPEGGK